VAIEAEFGCELCCGEDAAAAMEYYFRQMKPVKRLIDRSHFSVSIRMCPNCEQQFVSTFTEFVDWQNGEDAQYFTVVPATQDEVAKFMAEDASFDFRDIGLLGVNRRRLTSDWPTGGDKVISWKTGVFSVREGY